MHPKIGYIYKYTMYEYIVDVVQDVVYYLPEDEYLDSDDLEFYLKHPCFSTDIFYI